MSMKGEPGTKERLLFAAIKVFARDGYAGATVRDICREAGAGNMTAINYHFGGKRKLYDAVLYVLFAENQRRRHEAGVEAEAGLSPEERLHRFLDRYMGVLFSGEEIARDAVVITLREMAAPSETLGELVDTFSKVETEEMVAILRDILGPDVPDDAVRDSLVSVVGQILYYVAFWPVFSRVFPEHPGVEKYRPQLLEHIMRFSMAGLKATRTAYEQPRGRSGDQSREQSD